MLALGVFAGIAMALRPGLSDDNPTSNGPTGRVVRGPLVISVTERGELESERRKVVSNELRWPVIIKEVAAEGTLAKEGQIIIQFECKELIDAIEREELDVTTAKNNHLQATQNLLLKEKEMDNNVLKAKRALNEAKEDRKRYIEHEYPIISYEKDSAVKFAEEDLSLAEGSLKFMKEVNSRPDLESPFTRNETEAAELKVKRFENNLKKAELELKKFKEYDHKRKLRELKEKVDDGTLALKRAELEAQKQLLIANSDEQSKKRRYEMREKKLKELREDEKKLTVKAEKAGLVVYNTGRGGRFGGGSEIVIAKGEKINPRQQLLIIPDMSTLQIKTRVYEAMIDQIAPGLPAVIRLDSKPDLSPKGKVSKVAVLPDSQRSWLNPDLKVFSVTVKFDKIPEGLKPGMTCEVELVLARLKDVLSVPIAGVFTEQEKTICYHGRPGGVETVEVKVGRMNDRRVEIISGLAEGDEVLLVPPEEGTEAKKSEGAMPSSDSGANKGSGR